MVKLSRAWSSRVLLKPIDLLRRYLLGEPINFQSVATARATLDAAHQYLCPELVYLAVEYLERNLNPSTVLEIYQGLNLYASPISSDVSRSFDVPTAPPTPGDDAGEIGIVKRPSFHVFKLAPRCAKKRNYKRQDLTENFTGVLCTLYCAISVMAILIFLCKYTFLDLDQFV